MQSPGYCSRLRTRGCRSPVYIDFAEILNWSLSLRVMCRYGIVIVYVRPAGMIFHNFPFVPRRQYSGVSVLVISLKDVVEPGLVYGAMDLYYVLKRKWLD